MLWSILIGAWERRLQWILLHYSTKFVLGFLCAECCSFYVQWLRLIHFPKASRKRTVRNLVTCYNTFCCTKTIAGSRSHWSPLLIWGWLWSHWYCHSSTIYNPFNGWNTGLALSSPSLGFYITWTWFVFVALDLLTFGLPGFIGSCTTGVAWYANSYPVHTVMARENLLLWDNLATPWPLQVGLLFLFLKYLHSRQSCLESLVVHRYNL